MKLFYTLIVIALILVITLLVFSFIYFEKNTHKQFRYVVFSNDSKIGEIEINVYHTEENAVYKSSGSYPDDHGLNKYKLKFNLHKKTNSFQELELIKHNDEIKEAYYLQNSSYGYVFLAQAKSKFAFNDNFSFLESDMPFAWSYPATWLPFVARYNFKHGGSQKFRAIKIANELLPPYQDEITVTSIRDEYISVDNKKVKTECLVFRDRSGHEGFIWVSKNEHFVIKGDVRTTGMNIRLFSDKIAAPAGKHPEHEVIEGIEKKMMTYYADNKEINALLVKPGNDNIIPAVILVGGEDMLDLNNGGMFKVLSDFLASKGYAVMTYVFSESGLLPRIEERSLEMKIAAFEGAIGTLLEYRFIDPSAISVISHSDANSIVPYMLKSEHRVKKWVMISPRRLYPVPTYEREGINEMMDAIISINPSYEESLDSLKEKTLSIVSNNLAERKNIFGRKIYLSNMRQIMKLNPEEDIKKVNIPILWVEGKNDPHYAEDSIKRLYKIFDADNNPQHTFVLFRNLGHYLVAGKNSGLNRHLIIPDKEALMTIEGWLSVKEYKDQI